MPEQKKWWSQRRKASGFLLQLLLQWLLLGIAMTQRVSSCLLHGDSGLVITFFSPLVWEGFVHLLSHIALLLVDFYAIFHHFIILVSILFAALGASGSKGSI